MTDSKGGVAAVDRALTILEAFRKTNSDSLSLAAIAAQTGFYKSTILRLIASLERFGYIRQLDDGRYKLGSTLSALGALYRESFRLGDFINPALEYIVNQLNESASFIVVEGDQQLILFRRDTSQRVRDHLGIGDTMSMADGGASVKIIHRYSGQTASTLDPKEFCEFSFGERNPEMAGIATPVFDDANNFIGVMTVTGPLFRFTKKAAKEFAAVLVKESVRTSLSLGASPALFKNIKY